VNVSAVNPMPSIKRTSLNVYGADIFNCSRQGCTTGLRDRTVLS